MIRILDRHDCCGYNACVQKCPKQCISMHRDEEGFLYPIADFTKCIDCHFCEKICPYLNQEESWEPLSCYAAKSTDEEVRKQSSSGGIFAAIAERVIAEGGVVFGACFDNNWQVFRTCVETKQGLATFRGSEYVQSQIGETFKQTESFLKEGRKILFSGAPCQISGLNHYLHKKYNNLLTIEIVCHSIPNPKIWREYLESLNLISIGHAFHRDRSTGWRGYPFTIKNITNKVIPTERAGDNKYLMAFVRNLTLRPSCFSCPAKASKSRADMTLADYWGIEYLVPEMDDNEGSSFICGNAQKGEAFIKHLNTQMKQIDYQKPIHYNPYIFKSSNGPVERQQFWSGYKCQGIKALLSLKSKRQNILKRVIKRLF